MRDLARLLLPALLTLACSSGGAAPPTANGGSSPPGAGGSGVPAPVPFEALPAHAAVRKVKGLLTGLPVTAEELAAVRTDGRALATLIDGWMATPQFRDRMLTFFQQAFQQTQTDVGDYVDMLGKAPTGSEHGKVLVRSIEESSAPPVRALVERGPPSPAAAPTATFMPTPPLMSLLAWLDGVPRDDDLKIVRKDVWPLARFPGF